MKLVEGRPLWLRKLTDPEPGEVLLSDIGPTFYVYLVRGVSLDVALRVINPSGWCRDQMFVPKIGNLVTSITVPPPDTYTWEEIQTTERWAPNKVFSGYYIRQIYKLVKEHENSPLR